MREHVPWVLEEFFSDSIDNFNRAEREAKIYKEIDEDLFLELARENMQAAQEASD